MVQYLKTYEMIKPTNLKFDPLADVLRKLVIDQELKISQVALEDIYRCLSSSYIEEHEDDLETQLELAYEHGYGSGYDDGYDDGYDAGYLARD